jgi:class 3 adenylate cyclase
MYWDLLCPECRSVTDDFRTLKDLHVTSHCPSCNIDFTANFDHNIEIIFRPNPSIRTVDATVEFCVGNPQRQPKIAFNFIVPSGEELPFTTVLEEGRYALVASDVSGSQSILVAKDGLQKVDLTVAPGMTWNYDELKLNTMPQINLINKLPAHQTFKMSRASWSDQAATAADVTSLQVFRDLFSSEVLRSGEQISVGSVTIMFTDLRSSTKMYREIGDASAFGRVREHFETLQRAIAQEGGSVVKTIGDSVMATFRQPSAALQAIVNANAEIKEPLMLKIGVHHGPCLVVNLNDRLDYFGSTVNIAARLPNFSNGSEIIFTETIYNDPGTHAFLSNKAKVNSLVRFNGDLKGFDEPFTLWRMDLRK